MLMKGFSSKQKGDVAEYRVVSELLVRGFPVLKPLGDRMPYDLAVDREGTIFRIQVKLAWYDAKNAAYQISVKRSQTNRKVYKYTRYTPADFDFLVGWLADLDVFYIFPAEFACSFSGSITIVEGEKRQRAPRSAWFRNRWELLLGEPVDASAKGTEPAPRTAFDEEPASQLEADGRLALEELEYAFMMGR